MFKPNQSPKEAYQEQLELNTRMVKENSELGKENARLKQEVEDSKREVKKWKEDRDYFAKLFGSGDIHEAIDKYENLQADVERLKLERQYASDAKELSWKEKHELEARLQKEIEKGNAFSSAWMKNESQLAECRRVLEFLPHIKTQIEIIMDQSGASSFAVGRMLEVLQLYRQSVDKALALTPADALKRAELDRAVVQAAERWYIGYTQTSAGSLQYYTEQQGLERAVEARREGLNPLQNPEVEAMKKRTEEVRQQEQAYYEARRNAAVLRKWEELK